MAKDGTRRGGARAGAGRKPKSFTEKMTEGISAEAILQKAQLGTTESATDTDLPPMKEYLTEEQKCSIPLCSQLVYQELMHWLKQQGCDKVVEQQLIDSYVMSVARWIQCEQAISTTGFLSSHPTTGAPIASPYVAMSQTYMKQINTIWYAIFQIVKENSTGDFGGGTDTMEQLLGGA